MDTTRRFGVSLLSNLTLVSCYCCCCYNLYNLFYFYFCNLSCIYIVHNLLLLLLLLLLLQQQHQLNFLLLLLIYYIRWCTLCDVDRLSAKRAYLPVEIHNLWYTATCCTTYVRRFIMHAYLLVHEST